MAFAVKRMVGFGRQRALSMGANGGQSKDLAAFTNDEKALILEPGIHAICGVVSGGAGVYISGWAGDGVIRPYPTLTTGGQAHGQKQEFPPV